MKQLFHIILLALIITGCVTIESSVRKESVADSSDTISVMTEKGDDLPVQNDLMYHDYGTGVKLTKHSTLTIPRLNLDFNEEAAEIFVIELIDQEIIKLSDYRPMQAIVFTPASDGIYQIIASLSNGEVIDLTPKATIETSYTDENTGGFIPLK